MTSSTVKEQAAKLVECQPDDISREDLMYSIYVRQAVEAGLADSEAGRVYDDDEVRAEFGLDQ